MASMQVLWKARQTSGLFFALVYAAFGITDLILSLAAFALGIPEGNPFLAWLGQSGFFIPAKLGLTALVGVLITLLHSRGRIRLLTLSAIGLMAMVDVYHVWALNSLLGATG